MGVISLEKYIETFTGTPMKATLLGSVGSIDFNHPPSQGGLIENALQIDLADSSRVLHMVSWTTRFGGIARFRFPEIDNERHIFPLVIHHFHGPPAQARRRGL